jgi:excisionase family DNA binding protein
MRDKGDPCQERDPLATQSDVLTTDEVAALLKVSDKTVLRLAKDGSLVGRKVGRAWRFCRSDVLAHLSNVKRTPPLSRSDQAVYLDYNATSPLDPRVLERMLPYLSEIFGNPASTHRYGARAATAVELAREQVARLVGARKSEVVFTSGATEANNQVGRVTIASKKPGEHFSLAAVAKNVNRTFSHGAFEEVELDQKVDILIHYWTLIADSYPEQWEDLGRPTKDQAFKLLETTGLIAWSLSADDILGPAFNSDTKTMDWERVDSAIGKLAATDCVDWRKDGEFQGLTGEVGGARIHKRIQYCLQLDLSEDEFGADN